MPYGSSHAVRCVYSGGDECLTRTNGEEPGLRNPRRWLGINEKCRFFMEDVGNDTRFTPGYGSHVKEYS